MRSSSHLLVAMLLGAAALSAASAQTYKAIGDYKLPGSTARGIAVDSDGRRIFVATSDGITVLNADTGATVGTIAGLKNAEDVLLVPEMKGDDPAPSTRGFATDDSGHVLGFTLADMKASAPIKLATSGPASLCYDMDEKSVEAVSRAGSLTSIDPESGKVTSSHKLATGAGQIACGTLSHVYVADTAANVVHVLNHSTGQNDGDFPMRSGHQPTGLSLDTKGRRLFVSCEDGTIEVIDTDAGFTFGELKSGSGPSRSVWAWTPQGKGQWKAGSFTAQQDGTLTGVRMMAYINYTLGGAYKLTPGLGSIAYDEKTHHLFITSANSGSPQVIVVGY